MTALADSQAESQFVRVRRRFYATFPFYPVLVNHKETNTDSSALSAAHNHSRAAKLLIPLSLSLLGHGRILINDAANCKIRLPIGDIFF